MKCDCQFYHRWKKLKTKGVALSGKCLASQDQTSFDDLKNSYFDCGEYGQCFMYDFHSKYCIVLLSNGNRTECSPIRSVIIRVITKSDDRAAGVRFVYHEYDYRQNWTTRSLVTN